MNRRPSSTALLSTLYPLILPQPTPNRPTEAQTVPTSFSKPHLLASADVPQLFIRAEAARLRTTAFINEQLRYGPHLPSPCRNNLVFFRVGLRSQGARARWCLDASSTKSEHAIRRIGLALALELTLSPRRSTQGRRAAGRSVVQTPSSSLVMEGPGETTMLYMVCKARVLRVRRVCSRYLADNLLTSNFEV